MHAPTKMSSWCSSAASCVAGVGVVGTAAAEAVPSRSMFGQNHMFKVYAYVAILATVLHFVTNVVNLFDNK